MSYTTFDKKSSRWMKGQSLVEVALFFPVFIIVLAGLVEVSQLVITQNRVSQAARVAARFGANGGEDQGMVIVALNSVTQTLDLDEADWDMWVVRGQVNDAGDGMGDWEFAHAYGISNTVRYSDVNEAEIAADILAGLQNQVGDPDAVAGIRFVGLYTLHDVESILGLDAVPWLRGMYSVRGLNYMRQVGETAEVTNGCSAFPIAVYETQRSVIDPDLCGNCSNPFPDADEFDHHMINNNVPIPTYEQFINHVDNEPLEDAQEGYVYRIQNGPGSSNFGWLIWNDGINAGNTGLTNSLTWPGDSRDYYDHNDGGQPATPLYPWVVRGYVNPHDHFDLALNIGDFIVSHRGSNVSNSTRDQLDEHIIRGRTLRVIVYDTTENHGGDTWYRTTGFSIFRLLGYRLSQGGGESWILAEFVREDNSCGQQPQP